MENKPINLKVIDLFSGCGGLSLGIQNAGFDVVAGFDNWKLAVNTYQKNFKHPVFLADLGNLQGAFDIVKGFKPDIIAGGPPCQDFSSAGKRDESLGRGDLTISFAEIVAVIKPQFFIMENVDRFVKSTKYKEAKQLFKSAHYGLSEKILDASLCGVPQSRKRFFWIGELGGEDKKIEPYLDNNLANEPLTIRQYFNTIGKTLDVDHYYRHPRSYKRRGVFSIDEPSPTVRGVNRPIPKTYKAHSGDSALVSSNVRPLTTIERSYLQTFPENFVFEGSKTDLEQLIGNAVPVKLAEYVARCLAEYIANMKS
ncbi:Modification methylase HindV [Planktothrix tepida]|uniref:Cytosine-specific methyltransferase n=2 Tax=Planktothrix TaxID=54304 RepID=A0A1J1LSG0_9CYAN|nr:MULTISPECIES: DNA cytosine methyltransferase [Planktothrix]CAD5946269.1 Modification methylase HindV [Planktothrix pseudagardhii]CAD5964418.1 Modification methylase HindV [Planktothrix tepida]CUR34946.1 Modification methylase HindV [Planktothrix tepida PCC 9214]